MPNKNKPHVNLEAVFRLKPNRTDTDMGECEIKLAGYVSPTDKLGDEPIEIETTKNEIKVFSKDTLLLDKIHGYDITVNAYRNNIIGNFLVKNRNLPVCSLQFMYAKSIVIGYLFNVFICFCLDTSKNFFLKSAKDYVNARVYGKYMMILDGDQEFLDALKNITDSDIEKYSIEDVALRMENKEHSENDEINKLNNMVEKDMREKKEFYKELLEGKEVKYKKNIKKMAEEYLFSLFNHPHINGLIKFALEIRAKKRTKEYGSFDGEYKIPSKVLKLNDIKNNPETVDKFIGSDSDSNSDSN